MNRSLEEQFMEMHEEMSDVIFRRCLFKVSDREVAKDLTQETFTKVWDYLRAGNEVDNLRGFTYTVANNLIKDYYKKKKATPMGDMEAFDPIAFIEESGENIEAKAELKQVIAVIQDMKEKDRDVLLMRFIEGKSPEEIAEILEVRTNTVSVRIHRAKKRLREIFQDDEE